MSGAGDGDGTGGWLEMPNKISGSAMHAPSRPLCMVQVVLREREKEGWGHRGHH